jgi:hypothetical protein
MNYLSRLALNRDPPDLCLLSSKDYRCEPPAQGSSFNIRQARSARPAASQASHAV